MDTFLPYQQLVSDFAVNRTLKESGIGLDRTPRLDVGTKFASLYYQNFPSPGYYEDGFW